MVTRKSPCLDNAQTVAIAGGEFTLGSDTHYPEEAPARRVQVADFEIDLTPVTNAAFAEFVAASSYVTVAERVPLAADYPGADPAILIAASMVFLPPVGPVPLNDHSQWWAYIPGAQWRYPYGPESTIEGLEDHPVVHVALEDAQAYARWAGKDLPSEVEWEFAARGGLDGANFAWGDLFMPGGQAMANTWHGEFPYQRQSLDGFERTTPVGSYPANGYGLFDMIGNVWEWTSDRCAAQPSTKSCCTPSEGSNVFPQMVIKGGSHLCAPNYCERYRPAARQAHDADTSTTHIGFRCIKRSAVQKQ